MHPLVAQLTAVNARLARGEAIHKRVVRDPASQQIVETIETRDRFDPVALAREGNDALAWIRAATDLTVNDRILATAAAIDFGDLIVPYVTDPTSRANLATARAANQDQLDAAGVRLEPR